MHMHHQAQDGNSVTASQLPVREQRGTETNCLVPEQRGTETDLCDAETSPEQQDNIEINL